MLKRRSSVMDYRVVADPLAANIMIADENYNITYLNGAVTALLQEAEADLQKELKDFRVDTLVGRNIDVFHKNPARQRQMLDGLKSTHRATITVGQRVFDLIANPLFAANGKRIGTVVEWANAAERLLNLDYAAQIASISRSQAVIEFTLDGKVVKANENFLKAMGYSLDEIRGQHHSMFVQAEERESTAYAEFWEKLHRGEYVAGEFKRIGKNGREVWLNASYNPILDLHGKPVKVVKFATDVTEDKLRNADYVGQISAIGKSQAVIEFEMDGTVRNANENFLKAMGYQLSEIKGKNHSIFVDPGERESEDYRMFWDGLRSGNYKAAEFKRIGKGGREVYIQASYNPILDLNGRPFKVVKFATDVTEQVLARKRAEHVRSILESVAAGAEELSASVQEISASMVRSREKSQEAVDRVESADRSTSRLAEASQAMGGIVELISSITGQINLLALNATIESARAGEAGKGFAVVANEVKNLANQAKQATERISAEIGGLRTVSDDVTSALVTIKQSIDQVMEYVTSTASAVEEQSAVAADMSSNMQRAAAEANNLGQAA